ncbi:hypothetical protein XA68_17207 [Ophiocordyceps unilateralis]|uniref:RING-type domain-containing protein n=1 Tax=Ophiocordyceps unilateralis TaxID=268505 RepID=A0A2A9PKP9_OPHUN|nr:hypothetical protein XA68_17207 [Ophiocordyceps unilateralis]
MDEESLILILQLQKEDIEHLKSNAKGKQPEGETCDFDLAVSMYQDSLEAISTQLHDRLMCKSIARAIGSDAAMIQACASQEAQAVQDRAIALDLNEDGEAISNRRMTLSGGTTDANTIKPLDGELMHKLERLNLSSDRTGTNACGESPIWASSRHPGHTADGETTETGACIICCDELVVSSLAKAPCFHHYCRACLNSLFTAATKDESLFPPRCCSKPIPVDDNLGFLAADIVGTFRAKQIEFTAKDRTYCHRPQCSTFIPPQCIKDQVGTCLKCSAKTCVTCKGAPHDNEECPKDSAFQELLRVANKNSWQQCFSCHRVVELKYGCNHISSCSLSISLFRVWRLTADLLL